MSKLRATALVLSMLASVVTAVVLTPKPMFSADHRPDVALAALVPNQFGDWRSDTETAEAIVSPDVKASLARYYTDTLSRTYFNSKGDRVMLALAYGADQGRAMQVHKPEVCYEGQGFRISENQKSTVAVHGGSIPVMRLVARQDNRVEPITYWIRSGDDVISGWFEQNLARVKAGFKGHLPDGLLFRVSTLDTDKAQSYAVQDEFIRAMVPALGAKGKAMMLGTAY